MISKAIKYIPRSCEESDDYKFLKKCGYYFRHYFYYPIDSFIRRYKERVKRSWDFAKLGWLNYDFDMSYVYEVMWFKLKRLYKCLENGHAIQEPEDIIALKELTKIVFRLRMDNYDRKYHRAHDKKWGKIESKSIPNYDEDGKIKNYTWNSWRVKTKNATKKVKEQERKQFLACYEKGEKDRRKDIDRLADILKKHAKSFWD